MIRENECAVSSNIIDGILKEKGRVVTVPVGISMWPMLKNRKDHIVIEPVKRPFKKYDIPLYRYNDGNRYVLHRIIKVNKDGSYVICGDNLWKKERNVTDDMISGILVGFFKGDRYIDCEHNKRYHLYIRVWRLLYPFRVAVMFAKRALGRIKRAIMQ